jgi:signal peptidase I
VELLALVAVALGAVWAGQQYLIKPYRIPSGSMQNTLMIGDHVIVARFWYDIASVGRGDIIVFHPPGDGQTTYIKRVIGLPGEWIGGALGQVWICHQRAARAMPQPGCRALREPYVSSSQAGFDFRLVPHNAYFVMGDNRQNSDDSRDLGPINASRIIGRAFLTYWPLDRIGLTG